MCQRDNLTIEQTTAEGKQWVFNVFICKSTEAQICKYIDNMNFEDLFSNLLQSNDAEVLAMISTELASKFLFNVGFRTKKNIRYVF